MSSTGFDDNPFGAPGSGTAAPDDNPFAVSTAHIFCDAFPDFLTQIMSHTFYRGTYKTFVGLFWIFRALIL